MDLKEMSSLMPAAKIEKNDLYQEKTYMHVHTYIQYEYITLFQRGTNDDSMILVHRNLIPGIDTGCIHQINDSGHCVINQKKTESQHLLLNIE